MIGRHSIITPGTTRGALTIIERLPHSQFRVRCKCGNEKVVSGVVFSSATKNCTCGRKKHERIVVGCQRGALTLLERLPGRKESVRCVCGREKVVSTSRFSLGTDRCTCHRGRKATKYIPGAKFGRLTIRERLADGKLLCDCECGNQTVVRSTNLREKNGRRNTSSCGCGQLEGFGREREYLNGQVFGDFRVVRYDKVTEARHVGRCQKCGNEVRFQPSELRANPTCSACDGVAIGQTFGNWTVLCHEKEALGDAKGRTRYWWCRCKCGKELSVDSNNLVRGATIGCRQCGYDRRRERGRAKRLKERVEKQKSELAPDPATW